MPIGAYRLNSISRTNAVVIPSRTPKTLTAFNGASTSTTDPKFGTGSISLDGVDDRVEVANSVDFDFAGDFTVEMWIKPNGFTGTRGIIYNGTNTGTTTERRTGWGLLQANVTGAMQWASLRNDATPSYIGVVASGPSATNAAWNHVAIVRSSGTVKVYTNGTGGTGVAMINPAASVSPLSIGRCGGISDGAWVTFSGEYYNGGIDEIRISNTARYTANFTPPTAPFDNDANTLLLVHANGTNGSTTFTDDAGPQ